MDYSDSIPTVTFDLTVGSGGLYGTIGAEYLGDCIREYIDNFMVTAPGVSTSMNGTLDFCYSDPHPAGDLEMTLTDTNVGVLFFDMVFHGSRYVDVAVYEMPGEDLRADCQVDLEAESAACEYTE
jgi:hypothetical protein